MINKALSIFFIFCSFICFSLIDSSIVITFDFNKHEIKEKDNRVFPRSEGVTLTADRFGNVKSAIYIHGNVSSYLNLSTSKLLKPEKGTVSLWVNLDRRVYSGKGYDNNPIVYTKNGQEFDFNLAYAIGYDCYAKRLIAYSSQDSLKDVSVAAEDNFIFGTWHHLVMAFDDNYLIFYVDGELQNKMRKGFRTQYLASDSVMIGHTASTKNERFSQGVFDDIQFFHRILSDKEIKDLYNAPNPNKLKNIFTGVVKYGIVIIIIIAITILFNLRNKKALEKQKEQFELVNKITELELKVVKAQMNPHFISNCLAAIQDLIFKNNVDEASRYIAKFSFFLRQILNYSNKDFITLSEEIEIIKLNIELEQLRFKNEFNFDLYIDEKIIPNDFLIPALITQTFIENAIWHGLLQLDGLRKPELKITFSLKNGYPVVEIEDNGIGRDLKKIKNEDSKGTKLISDKIESLNKLYKTSNYKLEIVDLFNSEKLQIGTKIRIHLDIVKE
ncbi:MAG: histidine kinase [Burkholderiales bacterium]|nr:histidine kinase [Bacteroidia bacterium]